MAAELNSSKGTLNILISASVLLLFISIGSYFVPQLLELRKELWGVFVGFNSALMLALKTSDQSVSNWAPIQGEALLAPLAAGPVVPPAAVAAVSAE